MPVYKTEITSDSIPSDNPVHQRLLKPYVVIKNDIKGNVLELGCGEGRGVAMLAENAATYTGYDKIKGVIEYLRKIYPEHAFRHSVFPPLTGISQNGFDLIVSFQVIEHIQRDKFFLEEIYRVLKPGGTAYITTPNREMSLTRNPWHIREYKAEELKTLCESIFDEVILLGITGNEKVMEYYERNKKSVKKLTRFDILNLQYRLPAFLLKLPYEIMNRLNRNRLKSENDELVLSITCDDYVISDQPQNSLDLYAILRKK